MWWKVAGDGVNKQRAAVVGVRGGGGTSGGAAVEDEVLLLKCSSWLWICCGVLSRDVFAGEESQQGLSKESAATW